MSQGRVLASRIARHRLTLQLYRQLIPWIADELKPGKHDSTGVLLGRVLDGKRRLLTIEGVAPFDPGRGSPAEQLQRWQQENNPWTYAVGFFSVHTKAEQVRPEVLCYLDHFEARPAVWMRVLFSRTAAIGECFIAENGALDPDPVLIVPISPQRISAARVIALKVRQRLAKIRRKLSWTAAAPKAPGTSGPGRGPGARGPAADRPEWARRVALKGAALPLLVTAIVAGMILLAVYKHPRSGESARVTAPGGTFEDAVAPAHVGKSSFGKWGRSSASNEGSAAHQAASGLQMARTSIPDDLGTWLITDTVPSSVRGGASRFGCRVQLIRSGKRLMGRGEKWQVDAGNSRSGPTTAISLEGSLDGDHATLSWTEHGARRRSAGTYDWLLFTETGSLRGTFTVDAAATKGISSGQRIKNTRSAR